MHRVHARIIAVALLTAFVAPTSVASAASPPSAPVSLTVTPARGQVKISWDVPETSGGQRIDRYVITLAETSGLTSVAVDGAAREYLWTDLPSDRVYTISVDACNASGCGSSGSSGSFVAANPPGSPRLVSVAQKDGVVSVVVAPADNGGYPATRVVASLAGTTKSCETVAKPTAATVSCDIVGVPSGTYAVRVKESSPAGESADYAAAEHRLTSVLGVPDYLYGMTGNDVALGYQDKIYRLNPLTDTLSLFAEVPGALGGVSGSDGKSFVATSVTCGANSAGGIVVLDQEGIPQDCLGDSLANPISIARSSNGVLVVSDQGNHRVVQIDPNTGTQSVTRKVDSTSVMPVGNYVWFAGLNPSGRFDLGRFGGAGTPVEFQRDTCDYGYCQRFFTSRTFSNDSVDIGFDRGLVPRFLAYVITTWAWVGAPCANGCPVVDVSATPTYTSQANYRGMGTSPSHPDFVSLADRSVVTPSSTGLSIFQMPQAITVTGPPGAPTGVSAARGDASAAVSWSVPASDGGSVITGYTATASPGGASCTTTGATSCTITGLVNGTTYNVSVVAANHVGASNPVVVSVTPATVPVAASSVLAARGNASVVVSWSTPSDDGGSPITVYTATAFPGGASCTTTGAASCTVTGLTNGTAYTFTVTATNSVGASEASVASSVVTPATVPSAPTGVKATSFGIKAASLIWAASSRNGSPVLRYEVSWRIKGAKTFVKWTSGGKAPKITIKGWVKGKTYEVRVRAVNALGQSAASKLFVVKQAK